MGKLRAELFRVRRIVTRSVLFTSPSLPRVHVQGVFRRGGKCFRERQKTFDERQGTKMFPVLRHNCWTIKVNSILIFYTSSPRRQHIFCRHLARVPTLTRSCSLLFAFPGPVVMTAWRYRHCWLGPQVPHHRRLRRRVRTGVSYSCNAGAHAGVLAFLILWRIIFNMSRASARSCFMFAGTSTRKNSPSA